MSPYFQTKLTQVSGLTAQPYLYLSDLRTLEFPLPPLAEQAQIVAEIEAQRSELAKTEEMIEHSLKRAEQERQSILREAFAGRLVPQDPEDEPASVLLERIREERSKREVIEQERRKGAREMASIRKRQSAQTDRERIYYTLAESGQALKPEDLFRQADFKIEEQPESVETFQIELTPLEVGGAIVEERPDDSTVLLRAVELSDEQAQELFGPIENEQNEVVQEGESVREQKAASPLEQSSLWDM